MSAPTAAPKPPRLLVSTRQSKAPPSTAPDSTRVRTERSLITTISPIGSKQATNPARWFGLPNVDQTVLVGPNDAPGLMKLIQSQFVPSSTSAIWMSPYSTTGPPPASKNVVRIVRRSVGRHDSAADEREDRERQQGEEAVVGLVVPEEAEPRTHAEDRGEQPDHDHRKDRPMKAGAKIGNLRVRECVDRPERGENEGADHQQSELRDTEPLGGTRIERDRESNDDDERGDSTRATERIGRVPQRLASDEEGDGRP